SREWTGEKFERLRPSEVQSARRGYRRRIFGDSSGWAGAIVTGIRSIVRPPGKLDVLRDVFGTVYSHPGDLVCLRIGRIFLRGSGATSNQVTVGAGDQIIAAGRWNGFGKTGRTESFPRAQARPGSLWRA